LHLLLLVAFAILRRACATYVFGCHKTPLGLADSAKLLSCSSAWPQKHKKNKRLTKKETAWQMHRASDVAAVDVAAVAAAFPLELTHGVTFVDASQSASQS